MWSRVHGKYLRVSAATAPSPYNNMLVVTETDSKQSFLVHRENCHAVKPQIDLGMPAHRWHGCRNRIGYSGGRVRHLCSRSKSAQRAVLAILLAAQLTLLTTKLSFITAFLASYCFGAFAQFNMQAMMHEICHRGIRVVDHVCFLLADSCFGLSGPGFYIYYSEFHLKHHADVGSPGDPDFGFHMLWSNVSAGRLRRLIESIIIAAFTKILLSVGHVRGTKKNILFVAPFWALARYAAFTALFWASAWRYATPGGFLYLTLSACFSMGAACHPCLLSWITQHCASVATRMQPTISYSGSGLFHSMHLGALYHTEHHDFPLVPFYKLHLVRGSTPDLYRDVVTVKSALKWIMTWLRCETLWMDAGAQLWCTRHAFCAPHTLEG